MAAAMMVSVAAMAQDGVKFGVKAGANMASMSKSSLSYESGGISIGFPDLFPKGAIVGFQVGGFANIGISDLLSFQPELVFATQGAKGDINIDFNGTNSMFKTANATFNSSYVNIPLLLEIKPVEKLGILVGPQVGFLVSEKFKLEGEDVDSKSNTIDFGAVLGAQYNITDKLSLGLRYNMGLTKVYKEVDGEKFDEDGVSLKGGKNNVASFSVGYTF